MTWALKDEWDVFRKQRAGKAFQGAGQSQAKAWRQGSSQPNFQLPSQGYSSGFFGGSSSLDSYAYRPINSLNHGAARALKAAAVGGFLSVQVAVGLMVQLSTPQDTFEQLSTKKGTVDFVVSSTWRGKLEQNTMGKLLLEEQLWEVYVWMGLCEE